MHLEVPPRLLEVADIAVGVGEFDGAANERGQGNSAVEAEFRLSRSSIMEPSSGRAVATLLQIVAFREIF